jgi:hypothetical protein
MSPHPSDTSLLTACAAPHTPSHSDAYGYPAVKCQGAVARAALVVGHTRRTRSAHVAAAPTRAAAPLCHGWATLDILRWKSCES